jgi:hypothetical protein
MEHHYDKNGYLLNNLLKENIKMKTAMEQLWEYIEANYNEDNFNIFDAKAKSLELEKKQIIDAYKMGNFEDDKIVMTLTFYAEKYYKSTYD